MCSFSQKSLTHKRTQRYWLKPVHTQIPAPFLSVTGSVRDHHIQEGKHDRSSWNLNTQICHYLHEHKYLLDSHICVWSADCASEGFRGQEKGEVLINTSAVHGEKIYLNAYRIYHSAAAAHHRLLLKLLPHNCSDSSPELTFRHNTQLFTRLASILKCIGSNKSLKWISTTVCIGI